jgi:hypothetical protein
MPVSIVCLSARVFHPPAAGRQFCGDSPVAPGGFSGRPDLHVNR